MQNGRARSSNHNMSMPKSPSGRRIISPRSPQSAGLSYPNIKQRGYYSDILAEGAGNDVTNVAIGPSASQSTLWKAAKVKHTPKVNTFKGPDNEEAFINVLKEQQHGPTSAPVTVSDFPTQAWAPKVQLPYKAEMGQVPRKIEIERRKRIYAKQDINNLLEEFGVNTGDLMPREDYNMSVNLTGMTNGDVAPFPSFLPLHIFDDTEYDTRTSEEWINLGMTDGVRKPVPGKALLPTGKVNDGIKEYEWLEVGALSYDKGSELFLVQIVGTDGLQHNVVPEEIKVRARMTSNDEKPPTKKKKRLNTESQFSVPRIRVLFNAEDPMVFAERVAKAFALRRETEALLRYNLYIDCMPMDGVPRLDSSSIDRMVNWARDTRTLRKDDNLEENVRLLCKEVQIDFARSMNRITFDRVVSSSPDQYPYVTIQEVEPEVVPERGFFPDVPAYPFDEKFDNFAFNSLLTRKEAILAMGKVITECNKVSQMSVFQVPVTKSMKLEEFEQTQSQVSSQVQIFLRDSWLNTLRTAIRSSLMDVGKGWFNMDERNWEVYKISKLSKFMELVKFAMQDSLRYLVQDSLAAFTNMILDACCSVIDIPEELDWGTDILNSPYKPKKNALFMLDLTIDKGMVAYNTELDAFGRTVITLFDKGIIATKNVPQLEKMVLEGLFWSGTPLLESVGENEPEVVRLREKVRHAIMMSLIPLKAYAKQYEKYLELQNLDINQYLEEYDSQEHTAAEVKQEIERHLKDKEVLENTLPSSIVIGPYWVLTESIRKNLAKKRKALADAVIALLAKKLRKQADEVCEEFKLIARRLYDKPNSIEELAEQREYMKGIPELLKKNQELIDKAMVDYELIEEFNYNISAEDFSAKWTCISWPYKIQQQMDATEQALDADEERFQKNLLSDQNTFQDRLDSLNMAVAGFAAHTDISKAHEVANEVRRLVKQLKECQTLAHTYNNRERLFNMPVTSYEKLGRLIKEFEPFKNMWLTASDWQKWHDSWMNDPLTTIDAEQLEQNVNNSFKTIFKCYKHFKEIPACQQVAYEVREKIEAFKPYIPLIQGLRNPGMRSRHWEQLSKELCFPVVANAQLTFTKCLEMGLQDHTDIIAKIGEIAGKEYSIEQALDKMESEWKPLLLDILAYKETGTFIMKVSDDCSQLLDDHIVMTQSMSFSPYKKPFEDRITSWEGKLVMTQDVMDEWLQCQRNWLYLEPIFSSEDINRQLPVESKRYQTMERIWRKVMNAAKSNPQVISLCPDARLLESLRECNKLLEQVQKGLSEYLETKRTAFPRFYFLSDDELLEILSQTKDPTAVQPHLRKCFENIAKLKFEEDLRISSMFSGEGENVDFSTDLYPTGNVEDWLLEVENTMRNSLRDTLRKALELYPTVPRTEWVLQWPGQVVIAGCQTFWTREVTEALQENSLGELNTALRNQLNDLVTLVRGDLSKLARLILGALIVIEVHACDVAGKMVEEGVQSANDFEWISQLRYYWEEDNMVIRAVNAQFDYGYEYLGNTGRLVITPLTDRCYLTLTGALHLKFGGAPAGPAGTGKTETTKDLGKAMAVQCVVFNCSDQLDFMAMGKFFKGLASAGAWACFDEFNRIDVEVLSVVAQQISTIQQALEARVERFMFEGVELNLKPSCAVFITMNPGYAGRTELPDNLKALFRPVAMMVPNYALIAEISLFSFGFSEAKGLAKKITTTFKLSSEQLSSQDHYDFGMRAVKTVISAAGNLKREAPDMSEELIVLRAIRDVNVPKFLQDDLKLFRGIVSDLFPHVKEQPIDYGVLEDSIRKTCLKTGLQDVDGFVTKCIQLYETTVVRHGLMLVGPTGSGKTQCYEVLKKAMTALKGQKSPAGNEFEEVHTFVLNPKSITMGQLYGEFDLLTHEWTDGILSSMIRGGSSSSTPDLKWYVFDGPVDAVWIENMNTVLDDNKKLCLTSGEIIKLSEVMTMMFEVQDLAVASPATVSRCGMVYLEPSILGLSPYVVCYLKRLPDAIFDYKDKLQALFDGFLESSLKFIRDNVKEYAPTVDSNLTCSLMRLLDCFFQPFVPREGQTILPEKLALIEQLIEPWFIFSLIWSVGGTTDSDGRKKFSEFLRKKMKEEKIAMPFPAQGLVFDYRLMDGGASSSDDDDEEESKKSDTIKWCNWMEGISQVNINQDMRYSDIIVPTLDLVRGSFILEKLVTNHKKVLCVGPTGSGKTLAISDKLLNKMPHAFLSHFINFSARTSANQTQDIIDGKLDKRRKGVFGPPLGKYYVLFVDDLNMPALEVYGAQPPIEILRQYCDHKGWYDRKAIGVFRELVDITFVCAMGPPGGGRNPVTPRFLRHFNHLSFTELEDSSKQNIFSSILKSWLVNYTGEGKDLLNNALVMGTLSVYNTVITQLLPTPAKSHYTFNLRDLSKVFQGILMALPEKLEQKVDLLRLWYHENCRVFQDRLVNDEDRLWFNDLMKEKLQSGFQLSMDEVVGESPMIYGDFMIPSAENRIYAEITDYNKMVKILEEYLEDYNQINTAQMKLVLFSDAVRHLARIGRVIRQPLGNALLLGMGGSGRQSLTRLAAHMAEYECFQIELAKNYGVAEWREDLKKILLKAGVENKSMVFLFSDTQIKSETFLEDLNNVLNAGDVPNIFAMDELDNIYTSMKPVVQDEGMQPTKANLYSAFTKRVKSNTHSVICMSPIGEIFRARLRQFPSLVNCCTIDWFSAWPAEALRSVASYFLNEIPELEDSGSTNGLVSICGVIHQSVADKSIQYLAELSRHNYVTPTSYLELLGTFRKLIGVKKSELQNARNRTKTGLDKLLHTAEEVVKLQEELESMQPLLAQAAKETVETMDQIKVDSVVANETKTVVQREEAEAAKKAAETQAIADDAQRDLDEALPALEAALASLKSLNKTDVVEVRALQRPPLGVKIVIEAVCIMKGVKPKKVAGEKVGTKVDDYWEPGKALLQDPGKFIESLFKYDKDNIPDAVITKIQPYIDMEDFTPAAIAKVSKACTSICLWVRAMHKYHFVAKGVAPKRAALQQATEELAETQRVLDAAKARLTEVEEGIASLQAKYEECISKKQELEFKTEQCTARLGRAEKLIGGLSDEKVRWREAVEVFDGQIVNIIGDVMISSGCIAYLGTFTGEYRNSMVEDWLKELQDLDVPHSDLCSLVSTLGNPVDIRNWQIAGLPRDNLSVENGVIVQNSQRWPLFIDPQGQANKWIKNFEKEAGLDVVKLTDRDFLRSLENAIRFGKPCLLENVAEELDPALEPILLKQTFKQSGSTVIKLGDAIIPYHDDFKFYITTKLPNPHYTPEVSTKVTIVNFTLSQSGLEDQMLALVVAEERPDLEEAKNQLIISNAKMKQELKEIEDKILHKLSASEGNPVDDIDLIATLEASKAKSGEIKAKVVIAEQTEKDIDVTRSQYIPVAVRTGILFFCTNDLANIDPMYQYSLEWFVSIFLNSIANADISDSVDTRIQNINEYFTFSLYSNVCRSMFEKDKLLFSFLVCVRILMNENKINMDEWRFLLAGGTAVPKDHPNPAPDWLSERAWGEILKIPVLPKFAAFAEDFSNHIEEYKRMFDSADPHREVLPEPWNSDLDMFQKMLVLKCLRVDKVTNAMQDFVAENLGQRFIEPQTADLSAVFKDSSPSTPLIFVLSVGTDPAADLYKFAEEMRFSKKLNAISLGQGQGPRAEALMRSAMERGKWVFFQNCHLAPSWMPTLERLIENIDADKVHRDFRLWLTSMPSPRFPVSILQNGSKMTVEPPRGIKANLLRSYVGFSDDFYKTCSKEVFKPLLFSLCLFHGVTLERRKFGPLGFNIPYEFTTGDLRICISQLSMFLDEYEGIPFKVLKYTAGHINYGGRVTDDWDRRCIMTILDSFYSPNVVESQHKFSISGIYHSLPDSTDHEGYVHYIRSLPINDTPEIFSLHDNANITFAQNETFNLLHGILKMQPKASTGKGRSREEVMEETAKGILERVPQPIPLGPLMEKYPVRYEESMNTVLVQEVIRYNKLLVTVRQTLNDLLKALKGLVVMSQALETMSNSLFDNSVPDLWAGKAYPSLKPLASWVLDLVARIQFVQKWIDNGIPPVFWISGFFFPQGFLTGTLQNFARAYSISIDIIAFDFEVLKQQEDELKTRPKDGCYIRGLFLEGARWDTESHELAESRPKELFTDMPIIWLKPAANREKPSSGIYDCPVYKTLTRAGTLSTTGHSTNFVLSVEIPSGKPQDHWIKQGVALMCALNY
ncbi:dynein axonemal heavy chain 1-like isoform X2 [Nematostella vectensis]|uniref:dynein axonemal heavy chain 1-like isoform X2 n=1 Tax=Nematostella vectensis TaxID=45351 RepID=UPI002076F945|nr:dynein axonemal heavy chain 1-like isoform X2 [Nematostella vectensis]